MVHKKKIAMILPNLKIGGAEKISLLILNNLSDELFEKHLIIFSKKGKNYGNIKKNINIIHLKNSRLFYNSIKICKIIKNYNFDTIFSSFYHINIFLGFLKFFFNFKLVIRESNDPVFIIKNHPKKKIVYYLFKYFYPKADRVILPAKYLKKRFKDLDIHISKIKVIYNPVYSKSKEIKKKNNDFYCAVGRLTYQKGFDRLIKIVNKSKIRKLYIIGSGSEKQKLFKISNKKKIRFIKETDPKKYLLQSKALFFSSRWEGMPNILLESLMYGTKIISISKIYSVLELKNITKKNSITFANKKNFDNIIKKFSKINKTYKKNLLPTDFNLKFAIDKYQKELY